MQRIQIAPWPALLALVLSALALSGCVLVVDDESPTTPAASAYTVTYSVTRTGAASVSRIQYLENNQTQTVLVPSETTWTRQVRANAGDEVRLSAVASAGGGDSVTLQIEAVRDGNVIVRQREACSTSSCSNFSLGRRLP